MSGFGPPPADWAERYARAMRAIEAEWQPLVDALRAEGAADAAVWQTGGMCIAIGWQLDDIGSYAMLTSSDGPLGHERADEKYETADGPNRYYVGVYAHFDGEEGEGFALDSDQGRPWAAEDDELAAKAIVQRARCEYERIVADEEDRRLTIAHAAYLSVWCHAGVPSHRVRGCTLDTGVVHGPQAPVVAGARPTERS